MRANYNKLFKLLIDRKMKKGELRTAAGISATSLAKLNRGKCVTTDILIKICAALKCDFADIMEIEYGEEDIEKEN
jgi:DNA-binding Xre family transcriptional regulator